MNRAQNELQLRLLAVPASPTPPSAARTLVTERSRELAERAPGSGLPQGRPPFSVALGTNGLCAHLPLRAHRVVPRRDPGQLARRRAALVRGRGRGDPGRGAHRLRVLRRHARRIPASATSTALASTAPAARASPRRTAPTACSCPPTAASTPIPAPSSPPALGGLSSADGLERTRSRGTSVPRPSAYEHGSYEWAEIKARDGAVLYGSLLKPAVLRPQEALPGGGERLRRTRGAGGAQRVGRRLALRSAPGQPRLPGLVDGQPGLARTAATPSRRPSTTTWDKSSSKTSWPESTT